MSSRQAPTKGALTTGLTHALVVYLAAVLLLQSLAAAWMLGAGPLHRHAPRSSAVSLMAFLHHGHAHTGAQRHHHGAGDHTAQPDAAEQAAAEAASAALTAALALMATQTPRMFSDTRRHQVPVDRPWFWRSVATLPLYRPPSQA